MDYLPKDPAILVSSVKIHTGSGIMCNYTIVLPPRVDSTLEKGEKVRANRERYGM